MLAWKQGCLGFIPFYNLTSKCGQLAIYPGVKDKKVAFTAIRQTMTNKIAEFLTKTEQKKCKNTQTLLRDGY